MISMKTKLTTQKNLNKGNHQKILLSNQVKIRTVNGFRKKKSKDTGTSPQITSYFSQKLKME